MRIFTPTVCYALHATTIEKPASSSPFGFRGTRARRTLITSLLEGPLIALEKGGQKGRRLRARERSWLLRPIDVNELIGEWLFPLFSSRERSRRSAGARKVYGFFGSWPDEVSGKTSCELGLAQLMLLFSLFIVGNFSRCQSADSGSLSNCV